MIRTKNGVFKPYSSDFLLHVQILLLLVFSCGGDSPVTGTSQQVVAMLGEDATLPCYVADAGDAGDLTLEWSRSDLDPRFVLLRRGGVELQHEKHSMYAGRSWLSTERLKCGDVSLKLSEVKLTDSGTYRCLVPTTKTDSEIQLIVGSVSSPTVHVSAVSNGVSLDCQSKGWYPEPEVLWLDNKGKVLSAKPAETLRGPDGLFTVGSKLTVEKRNSNSFTCRVHQQNINETRETHIQIPVEFFLDQSSSAARIIICVIVSIIPVVAVVLVIKKLGQTKKSALGSSRELQALMDGQGDREQSMTVNERIKYLNDTKVKLDEQLEKTEGEFEHVEEVITTLTKQKTDLKKQREKIISLQQDDKVKIEENKKKLAEPPKTNAKDKMKKREKTKEDLEDRQKEHGVLLKTTEDLLESTDVMINKMTERKGKLKKDKEQIIKLLKETKRQLEVLERQKTEKKPEKEQSGVSESQTTEKKPEKEQSGVSESQTTEVNFETEQSELFGRQKTENKPEKEQFEVLERQQIEVKSETEQSEVDGPNQFSDADV